MKYARTLLPLTLALSLLPLVAGTASAGGLGTSSRSLYITWDEPGPSGQLTIEASGMNIGCDVRLLGEFHSTVMIKAWERLSGLIRHVEISECGGGIISILNESLPWHVKYESFTGSLPGISSVRFLLNRVAFLIQTPFGQCLGIAEAGDPFGAEADLSSGNVTGFSADSDRRIPVEDLNEAITCDLIETVIFIGTAEVENGAGRGLAISLV